MAPGFLEKLRGISLSRRGKNRKRLAPKTKLLKSKKADIFLYASLMAAMS
jgi:hypothetical protein